MRVFGVAWRNLRVTFCVLFVGWGGSAAAAVVPYATQGVCGSFPRVDLRTMPSLCVGLVADHLGFARGVAVQNGAVYVVDMGGWRKGHGRLLRLGHDGHDAPEIVLSGLDEPSALLAAPDGGLYLGLLNRVVRLDPGTSHPVVHDVLTGLPGTGRHPLAALALGPDGALYVNIGSGSDHCEQADGRAPDPKAVCPERARQPQRAEIVRVSPAHPTDWAHAEMVATGLRNSMGLAVTASGALIAAVNERDAIGQADPALSDATLPNDVLNRIVPGADYGWPYCFDGTRANPEYAGRDCKKFQAPTMLLPAHAAPLGIWLMHSAALGIDGQLVMAYHGYRAGGHRLVRLRLGADGQPMGAPVDLVWGWGRSDTHPQGAPVGVAEDGHGGLLISEDHNGTLLRLGHE